ncbi:MAG TPA: ABC transporter permease [Allosphingosinicella sp.]|jgi:ABC-type transport system involved in multi-copper enzyme maturation permease subunit
MLDALSAEMLKLTRHKATWFLVWLYPVGLTIIFLLMISGKLIADTPPTQPELAAWLRESALVWAAPGSTFGRYLLAAFVAVVFAGEYGWNTWKLIVPHRSRITLIAAKYAVILLLFLAAFTLSAIISVLGQLLADTLSGNTVPAGVTLGALLKVHGQTALASLAPALLTLTYASLAAVLTRSTLAALVISIVAVTVEQLFFNFAPLFSMKAPGLVWALYHVLPGYHLANLASWIGTGTGITAPLPPSGTVSLSWGVSAAVAAAWIAGLAALTFTAFRRQDLN